MRRLLQILLCCLPAPSTAAADIAVLATDPAPQSLNADPTTTAGITFSSPIDPTSVAPNAFRVMGRWSGPVRGQVSFEEGNARMVFVPERPFAVGEWVTVQVARTIRSASGDSLPKGYAWSFWIRTRPTDLDLRERARVPVRTQGENRVKAYGACACDLDRDGMSDLMVPCENSNDVRILMNDGQGGYTLSSIVDLPASFFPSPIETGDFDLDDVADFAIGSAGNDRVSLLMGNGQGGFRPEISLRAQFSPRGLVVLDAEADGDDDIITANRASNTLTLLRNRGDGTFVDSEVLDAGFNETSVSAADANGDGIQDLFVALHSVEQIALLLGDGDGGYALSATHTVSGWPWMTAVGDVNGDAIPDVASVNVYADAMTVILGNGEGGFGADFEYATGGFPTAVDMGDLDGDGDLDLVASAAIEGLWTVYENSGNGTFLAPQRFTTNGAACATLHDQNGDGTLDISGIDEDADVLVLIRNDPADSAPPPILTGAPNPFTDETRIVFELSEPADVLLRVFDARGALVTTLTSGPRNAGMQEAIWNGHDDRNRRSPAGFYVCRLDAGTEVVSWRMIFLP